MPANKQG